MALSCGLAGFTFLLLFALVLLHVFLGVVVDVALLVAILAFLQVGAAGLILSPALLLVRRGRRLVAGLLVLGSRFAPAPTGFMTGLFGAPG